MINTRNNDLRLFYSFDSKHLEPYHSNSTRIRERISEALAKWSSVSVLKFQETLNVDKADVVVSFEKPAHPKVDPYEMADSVLAHAFRPGGGVGGDVHLRDDIDWDFRVSNEDRPEPGTTSFFAVVLHELGHSLGLDHSSHTDAVMFPSYSTSTGTMSKDDIEGIHHIYGVPVQPTTKRPVPVSNRKHVRSVILNLIDISIMFQPDDTMIFPDDDRIVPEPCDTSYDAIVYIHHEKFIFKGRFMWRPDSSKRMVKIRDTWPDLPERLTHVDAVYENDKGNLMFFIDRDIYEFRGIDLVEKSTLTALGIDDSVQKVDAVFKWNYNKQSYIFARQDYWRLDGERVDKKYPRKILPVWREVHNIDTAMSYGDDLYFFKGKYFYKFDPVPMRLDVMHQNTSAQVFMGCPAEEKPMVFENRFGEEVDLKDFADALDHGEPVVFKTDSDNPEKDEKLFTTRKPNSSSSHHLHIFFFLASLAVSRAFSSPAASF